MEWLSNNWLALALVLLVLIVLAAFGVAPRRGQVPPHHGGSCCAGMARDKKEI